MSRSGAAKTHRQHLEDLLQQDPAVLGANPDDVLAALDEDGINTLRELVARALELRRASLPNRPTPRSIFHTEPAMPSRQSGQYQYAAPSCQLVVNGEAYDPTDIARFNGKPLYMILGRESSGKASLWAFTEDVVTPALTVRSMLHILDGGPFGGGTPTIRPGAGHRRVPGFPSPTTRGLT